MLRRPAFRALSLRIICLLCALVPTALVLTSAARSRYVSPRERLLMAMPKDSSVLVNVSAGQLPASPDVIDLGRRGTRALMQCLANNVHAKVRARCASYLGAIGDRRALPVLHTALADWESRVRRRVIRALFSIPDASSFAPLWALYQRRDEPAPNRIQILRTLGALDTLKAVQRLRSEFANAKRAIGIRSAALRGIWRSRHLMAESTLVGDVRKALQATEVPLVLQGTAYAARLRHRRLVQPLIALIDHPHVDVRNKAVFALGKVADGRATKALLAQLPRAREARMLNNISFALDRVERKAFFVAIRKLIQHKQASIRLNAAFVLGDVGRPEGLPLLRKALADQSDYVKTSAIAAIGKLGLKAAEADLLPLADSRNLSIRREAIFALERLSKTSKRDLLYKKLFTMPSWCQGSYACRRRWRKLQLEAAMALGARNDRRVAPFLIRCVETHRCDADDLHDFLVLTKERELRARLYLAWLRRRLDLSAVIVAHRPKGVSSTVLASYDVARRRYERGRLIDLLGELSVKGSLSRLREIKTRDTDQRLRALVSRARLGDESATKALFGELDGHAVAGLPKLVWRLRRIKEPQARKRLLPGLKLRASKRGAVAVAVAAIRAHWAPDEGLPRLLEALRSGALFERELATRYLNRNRSQRLTWLLRRAYAREKDRYAKGRLRAILDRRRAS